MISQESKPLKGKVAIVTGGTRSNGMGHAASLAMAAMGANIVVAGLTERRDDLSRGSFHQVGGERSRLNDRVAEIQRLGVEAIGVSCDVTNAEDVERTVQAAVSAFGGVDILFNNAGSPTGAGAFVDLTDLAWDLQYATCVKGAAYFIRACIPTMNSRGGGSIINNSSIWATKAQAGAAAYIAAKAAVIGLTKSVAFEHGRDNIRCNAVLPGTILTEINNSRSAMVAKRDGATVEDIRGGIASNIALRRLGRPEEIGGVVAFLASDAASFITGVAIPVDGGVTIGL